PGVNLRWIRFSSYPWHSGFVEVFMIKINFDANKIQREVEKMAEKAYLDAIDRAGRSLGSDGQLIKVSRLGPRRQGTRLALGNISFPSDEVRRRFEEALKREFR